jgi:hypothetical protein
MVSTLASKPASANNNLTVTIEAATIQTPQSKTAAYTVDFNDQLGTAGFIKTNGSNTYTYGSDLIVKTQDQWGGANKTKYITQSKDVSSFNVKVNQDQKYFGFWWSAGDSANKIIFKNDGEEVAVFQTKDLVGFINTRPTAEKTLYYGNPNCLSTSPTPTPCGTNTGHKAEPFAYVNVHFNNQVYDEIVIQTLSGSKFESDNHTFSAQIQAVTGVNVPQAASAANDLVSTSEDSITTDNVLSNDSGVNLSVLGVNLSPTQLNNKVATNVGNQVTLASGALVTLNSNGTLSYNPNSKFESLDLNQTATDTFSYTIKDNQNNISTATVTMTINGVTDDSDGDGIINTVEGTVLDTDGDGILNYLDTDSDGDGIFDSVEGSTDSALDTDTLPNYLDTDSDGDGILDSVEGSTDSALDTDTLPNYLDTDSDGDGILDSVEGSTDSALDTDTLPNYLDTDSDGDGIPDQNEKIADSNDSGEASDVNANSLVFPRTLDDVDGDGKKNYLDDDSDGDGIKDQDDSNPYVVNYSD